MTTKQKPPTIHMVDVQSSQICCIGHCPITNTLAIQFRGKGKDGRGATYHYANVDADAFQAFRKAKSIGTHFGKVFKSETKKYPFKRVAEPPALDELQPGETYAT